ncbi:BrnT family toxin [Pseudooceanicola nanhaiensis]|jgi:uncharacterized DUF497 family protein|uniref:BrnT family toxin n=2 Tax=Pseudooceanicola nanhaiensis TaxID=375761 RepID=A0A917T2V9_9RHOB|nr:hypothetical protein GCM10011534_32550 [Pseudooceanicola nanhaiensis]
MFEWDEDKRRLVLGKHGFDLADAGSLFGRRHMIIAARSDVEVRFIALGILDDVEVAVVYTHRGKKIRLITARRMRRNEERAYRAYIAGRGDGAQGRD